MGIPGRFRRLGRFSFHAGIFLFWLASSGFLFYQQAWIPWVSRRNFSALARLTQTTLENSERESWKGIYADDIKIGYLHEKEGPSPMVEGGLFIWQEGRVVLSMLGERRDLAFSSQTHTDSEGQLFRLSAVLSVTPTRIEIEGSRVGQEMSLTLRQGKAQWSTTIPLAEKALSLASVHRLVASGKLEAGRPFQATVIDPLSLKPQPVEVRLLGRRLYVESGRPVLANEIELEFQGLTVTSWIAEDGTVLREESPWGWTLRREDPKEATRIDLEGLTRPPDLLSMVSVPSEVWIHSPREVTFLQAVISRPDRPHPEWVTVRAVSPSRPPVARPIRDPAFASDLASSPFIRTDDPHLERKAKSLVGKISDSWAAARRINDWVYRSVRKTPTLGLPVSTEVLRRMEGDCNEHTCLYVALARVSGIPCRIVMGLVYFEGVFAYHTWPRVYVGEWIDLDPTLGQAPADATHIPLMEADLEESVRMAPLVGKVDIHVESYR